MFTNERWVELVCAASVGEGIPWLRDDAVAALLRCKFIMERFVDWVVTRTEHVNRLEDLTMTPLQRQCLKFYDQSWPRPPVIQTDERWNNRQLDWALGHGYVAVGDHVAHETTDAGRDALAES